jgi:hypothetical protein
MVITLLAKKGGVGKSTVCLLLHEAFKKAGKSVAIQDWDAQGTSTRALSLIDGQRVTPSGEYDIQLYDTPPNLEHQATAAAVRSADIAIVITSPAPADIWEAAEAVEFVKAKNPDAVVRVLRIRAVVGCRCFGCQEEGSGCPRRACIHGHRLAVNLARLDEQLGLLVPEVRIRAEYLLIRSHARHFGIDHPARYLDGYLLRQPESVPRGDESSRPPAGRTSARAGRRHVGMYHAVLDRGNGCRNEKIRINCWMRIALLLLACGLAFGQSPRASQHPPTAPSYPLDTSFSAYLIVFCYQRHNSKRITP